MVELGVVLGLVGIGTGCISLVYARTQAQAAQGQAHETRRQAEQATQMTLLAANQSLSERLHDSRQKLARSPRLLAEMKAAAGPLFEHVEKAGGFDDYMTLREVMEVFQETYFLRRDGLVTDGAWSFMAGNTAIWTKLPSFAVAFDAAVQYRLLHPEFVAALKPVMAGQALQDPAPTGPTRARRAAA